MQLLKSFLLGDFPSGSSINYYGENFYVIGDDAKDILVLDKNYNAIACIPLFDHSEKRIPKNKKTDLEASTIAEINGVTYLLVLGSSSRKKRKKILVIPFSNSDPKVISSEHLIFNISDFVKRVEAHGVEEVNLEGACVLQNYLVIGNRGNRTSQKNYLIITTKDFWQLQNKADLFLRELLLPTISGTVLGVSELCYIPMKNILLVTLTSEGTNNAYDDGEIGDSYLGWITDASTKISENEIALDSMIKLSDVDGGFKKQKIEGICFESMTDNQLILHLISDNDSGESRLFKFKFSINPANI